MSPKEYDKKCDRFKNWIDKRRLGSLDFTIWIDSTKNLDFAWQIFNSGVEIGSIEANSFHGKFADRKCLWTKKNQYYFDTECGEKILLARGEIKEIFYCRKCGKKVELK